MRTLKCLIILPFITMGHQSKAQELPFSTFMEIERMLTYSDEVHVSFLDSFLLNYPESKYLIGMRIYMDCLDGNIVSAKTLVQNKASSDGKFINDTYLLLGVGMYLVNEEKEDSALTIFLRSRELDVESRNKWVRLELYYLTKESNRKFALDMLSEALELDKNFYLALEENVVELTKDFQFQMAIKHLTNFENFEMEPRLTYLLGYCYLNLEEYKNAENWFKASLEINQSVDALIGLGYIYQYIYKNNEWALKCYKEAFTIEPNNPTLNKRLGLYYKEIEEFKEAEKYLKKAIQTADVKEDYYSLIYVYVNLNKYSEAHELNKVSAFRFGQDRVNEFWFILIASLQGDIESAQKILDEFYIDYSAEDVDWLKTALKGWNIEIAQN